MLIYSGIITLDYDPSTDILVTSMPDLRQFALTEVTFCLGLIVDSIRNYHITKLLLDSSNSVIEVGDDAYKAITGKFAADLMGTRLRRIARVGTANPEREEKSRKLSAELRREMNFPAEYRTFVSKAEALSWLLEQD